MKRELLELKNVASSGDGFDGLRNLLLSATGSFSHGYHLEFATESESVAHALCDKLAEHDIFANISGLRVYIKDSESICNLLALVGANKSLYKLNDRIVERAVRNVSNRRANCDNANIARQLKSAREQVAAISKLDLDALDGELLATAMVRLENPSATLDELAAILKISKSGVKHRLKKLQTLC